VKRSTGFHLDFVGVGPQRNGSTWLHSVLERHPQLCLPSGIKETMFFDLHHAKGLPWYAGHFAQARPGQLCGEVGPTYFDGEGVADRIRRLNGQCRILINLRNPVEHATSLYRHHLGRGRIRGPFADCAAQMPRIVDSARYARHVPRWFDAFGPDRVRFVWLEDVRESPDTVFRMICSFLGVAEIPLPGVTRGAVNAAKRARLPALARANTRVQYWLRARRLYRVVGWAKKLGADRLLYSEDPTSLGTVTWEDRCRLVETFQPDVSFLEALTGRDLSAWRRAS
jgi:hypothetical protein